MGVAKVVRAMLPRDEYWRELASLAVWWSLWSLADTYLLPWTPVFELGAVSAVSLCILIYRIRERVRERHALAEQVLQEFQ
tara:strand:- start:97 stop:339 length:243 start_codon:yes stop_codon:yes gene_type:complete